MPQLVVNHELDHDYKFKREKRENEIPFSIYTVARTNCNPEGYNAPSLADIFRQQSIYYGIIEAPHSNLHKRK